MTVINQVETAIKRGAVLIAGLIAGGFTAYFIDGIPWMALPAVGLIILAAISFRDHRA